MKINSLFSHLGFSSNSLLDRIAFLLVLVLPIFAISIRHWVSVIFVVLVCISVLRIRSSLATPKLSKYEKLILAGVILFFVAYLISSLANGWDDGSWRILGKELRFIAFVPLYLYVRSLSEPLKPLGLGSLIALPINLTIVTTEVWLFGLDRAHLGIYGSLFSGPVSVLQLIAATYYIHVAVPNRFKTLALVLITAIAMAIAMQTSRSSMIGLLIWLVLYLTFVQRKPIVTLSLFITLLAGFFFLGATNISQFPNFLLALKEFLSYLSFLSVDSESNPYVLTSIGTRLEMLRATLLIALDNPFWGVGGYNFQHAVNPYIDAGKLHPSLSGSNHPHNVFAEVLVSKGLIGLSLFLALNFLSLRIFYQKYIQSEKIDSKLEPAIYGFGMLLTLLLMMQTEAAIVLKGNFIAIYLVSLAIYLATSQPNKSAYRKN